MALPRLTSQAKKQMSDLQNRLKFSLYLLGNLPGAWFFGCRVNHIDEEQCIVKLPYSWFSKNPFKSIYFAAQCAAAELSTGLPTAVAITGKASTSMLLVKIETTFHKKANQTAFFTCAENQKAQELCMGADPVCCLQVGACLNQRLHSLSVATRGSRYQGGVPSHDQLQTILCAAIGKPCPINC